MNAYPVRSRITPVNRTVLVKPDEVPVQSESGLFIRNPANEENVNSGVVRYSILMYDNGGSAPVISPVGVGDRITWRKYGGGSDVIVNGEKLLCIEVDDILYIEEKERE